MARSRIGRLILFLSAICFDLASARAPGPFEVPWSDLLHGPDGPWHAAVVEVGTPPIKVDVYPTSRTANWFLTYKFCPYLIKGGFAHCPASNRSTWDYRKSKTVDTTSDTYLQTTATWSYPLHDHGSFGPLPIRTFIDTISVGAPGGYSTKNNSIVALDYAFLGLYPNSQQYPISVGALSIGAPLKYYLRGNGTTEPLYENIIPSDLYNNNITASNSFALQVGSVAAGIKPSLVFGGYDKTRMIEPTAMNNGIGGATGSEAFSIILKDIGIGVAKGASPFSFTSKRGILKRAGVSSVTGMEAIINPGTPYINLPSNICDDIVNLTDLPVTLDVGLGLYLWNTSHPKYEEIVSSASYLSFTFGGGAKDTTIKVPWKLLNLTLDYPLKSRPTPYFPCFSLMDGLPPVYGTASLGRAFLQSSYLGANWREETGYPIWFLSQAPGPAGSQQADLQSIENIDTNFQASSQSWEDTWDGHWKVLQAPPPKNSSTPSTNGSSESSGLSESAKIGLGVGLGVGLPLLAALLLLIFRCLREPQEPPLMIAEKDAYSSSMNSPNLQTTDRETIENRCEAPCDEAQAKEAAPLGAPKNPAEALSTTPAVEAGPRRSYFSGFTSTPLVEAAPRPSFYEDFAGTLIAEPEAAHSSSGEVTNIAEIDSLPTGMSVSPLNGVSMSGPHDTFVSQPRDTFMPRPRNQLMPPEQDTLPAPPYDASTSQPYNTSMSQPRYASTSQLRGTPMSLRRGMSINKPLPDTPTTETPASFSVMPIDALGSEPLVVSSESSNAYNVEPRLPEDMSVSPDSGTSVSIDRSDTL